MINSFQGLTVYQNAICDYENCDVFIFFLTKNYFKSTEFKYDFDFAKKHDKLIVFILLETVNITAEEFFNRIYFIKHY